MASISIIGIPGRSNLYRFLAFRRLWTLSVSGSSSGDAFFFGCVVTV